LQGIKVLLFNKLLEYLRKFLSKAKLELFIFSLVVGKPPILFNFHNYTQNIRFLRLLVYQCCLEWL